MREKENFMDKLGRVVTFAGNAILMNLLFLASCFPVITIGQAWGGLLTAIRYNVRGDKWFDGFKFGFKKRFLRGTISWCVMLVLDVYFLWELRLASPNGLDTPLIGACLVFAMLIMVTTALQLLNVYVPTDVGNWLRNAANMVFKAPVFLLLAAALFWLPAILMVFWWDIFVLSFMIYIAAYFTLVATLATFMLKHTIWEYLQIARAEGTLIAEEGKQKQDEEA